jgi:hypothetical protein
LQKFTDSKEEFTGFIFSDGDENKEVPRKAELSLELQ